MFAHLHYCTLHGATTFKSNILPLSFSHYPALLESCTLIGTMLVIKKKKNSKQRAKAKAKKIKKIKRIKTGKITMGINRTGY